MSLGEAEAEILAGLETHPLPPTSFVTEPTLWRSAPFFESAISLWWSLIVSESPFGRRTVLTTSSASWWRTKRIAPTAWWRRTIKTSALIHALIEAAWWWRPIVPWWRPIVPWWRSIVPWTFAASSFTSAVEALDTRGPLRALLWGEDRFDFGLHSLERFGDLFVDGGAERVEFTLVSLEYRVNVRALFFSESKVPRHAFGKSLVEVVGLLLGLLESILDEQHRPASTDNASGEHQDGTDNKGDPRPRRFWK